MDIYSDSNSRKRGKDVISQMEKIVLLKFQKLMAAEDRRQEFSDVRIAPDGLRVSWL